MGTIIMEQRKGGGLGKERNYKEINHKNVKYSYCLPLYTYIYIYNGGGGLMVNIQSKYHYYHNPL